MIIESTREMQDFGTRVGALLSGGEIIELVGDVGAGKTTFVRGLAKGMDIAETVQSPSFTINRVYDAPHGLQLVHYDFYRLSDPGIMADELDEMLQDKRVVVVIEWAQVVENVLPADRLVLTITSPTETQREVHVQSNGPISSRLMEGVT